VKFKQPGPLSRRSRVLRSVLVLGVLAGNLLPDIGGVSLSLLSIILVAPVIVYEVLRFFPRVHPVLLIVPIFGLFALHVLYISPTSAYGEDKLERWLTSTLVTALCACLLRDRRTLYTFAVTWLWVAVALALLAAAGYGGGRVTLFDSNPIWFGRMIAVGAVIAVWLWWQRVVRPWLILLALAVLAVGLIVSGSRGPVLATIVGIVVLTLLTGTGRAWKAILVVCGGFVAILVVQNLPIFQESRFATLLETEATASLRDVYWNLTIPIIAEYPSGVGFGNWSFYAGNPRHLWPHNLFLEVFAELGVAAGLFLLLAVVVIMLKLAVTSRKRPTTLLVLGLLAVETVHVSVSGDLNGRTFWFMLTLGVLYATNTVLDALPPDRSDGKGSRLQVESAHN